MFITLTASDMRTNDYDYKGPTEGKVVLRADETRHVTAVKSVYLDDRRGARVLTTYGAVFIVKESPEHVYKLLQYAAKRMR